MRVFGALASQKAPSWSRCTFQGRVAQVQCSDTTVQSNQSIDLTVNVLCNDRQAIIETNRRCDWDTDGDASGRRVVGNEDTSATGVHGHQGIGLAVGILVATYVSLFPESWL